MIFTSTISPSLKIGLRLIGIWPDMSYAPIHWLIHMSCILTVHYFQYLYLFANFKFSGLQNLVDPLSLTLYYVLTIIKLITLWINRRVIREILAAIDIDWRECVNINQHLNLMKMKASNSQLFTNVWVTSNLLAASIYFGGDNAMAIMYLVKGDNYTLRPFPIKVLFPSEAQQSPLYELLVVLLFLQGMSMVYTVASINALVSTLVIHVSGQIEIIRQELKIISKKVSNYGSHESATEMLIEKHNKVISFSEKVDKLFSFIALLQIFSNTSVICLQGLIAITSVHNEKDVGLVRTIFAYGAIMMEIFIFCFIGEYLSTKSKSLADAGYESSWYNMPSKQSKNILLIILRSQKELVITAGGLVNLSLETFASIMKASASYISVLHAMY